MSNETFTQGDWVVSGNYIESNGTSVCAFGDTWVTFENFNANAHLISAAPEMYRALRGLLDVIDWPADFPERIKAAEAALAKADGEV